MTLPHPRKLGATVLVGLALLALTLFAPVPGLSDELDDLGIDPPAPSPEPSARASDDLDDLSMPGEEPKGEGGPGHPSAAGSALPDGVEVAWNLVTAAAHDRRTRIDRPAGSSYKPWQALRFKQEIEAILRGSPRTDDSIATLVQKRLDSVVSAAAPARESELETLARDLQLFDNGNSPGAKQAAGRLAAIAGDPPIASKLVTLPARGPAYTPFVDRARTQLYGPAGADWVVATLESGSIGEVEAALAYLSDAAPIAEIREVLARSSRLKGSTAARVMNAVGHGCREELIADLEKAASAASAAVARAAGESIGRIKRQAEAAAAFREDAIGVLERREMASRQNDAGLILYRGKQYSESYLKFKVAADLDPTDARYTYNVGSLLCRMGNVAEGVARIRRAIELGGEEPKYYERLIVAMRDLGRRKELMEFLESRGLRARYSAVLATIHLSLAREHVAAGEGQKALDAVEMGLARAVPERLLAPLLATKAEAQILQGNLAKARFTFGQALLADPHHQRSQDGMKRVDDLVACAPPLPRTEPVVDKPGTVPSQNPTVADDDPFKEIDTIGTKPSPGSSPSPGGPKEPELDIDL